RQAAQNAADAACTAGAMDLMLEATGEPTGHKGFTAGTAFDCSSSGYPYNASAPVPCKYADLNGYNGRNTTPGNQVFVWFPGTPAGVPGSSVPPSATISKPFMRVDVLDHVPTWFSGILSGKTTKDVRAFAACGVVLAESPIPILVLDPKSPNSTP